MTFAGAPVAPDSVFLKTAWEVGVVLVRLHVPNHELYRSQDEVTAFRRAELAEMERLCARCGELWPCRTREWAEGFVADARDLGPLALRSPAATAVETRTSKQVRRASGERPVLLSSYRSSLEVGRLPATNRHVV